jgi:citrate lyase beta subunit
MRKLSRMRFLPADGFILDLEDSVDASMKSTARAQAAEQIDRDGADLKLYVRVNDGRSDDVIDDVTAIVRPGLRGLVVPKVESPGELERIGSVLDEREPAAGMAPGSVRLLAAIESAAGVENAEAISTASPRLSLISLGYGDLRRDLRVFTTRASFLRSGLCEAIRARVALVSRAAGLQPPHDGASTDWSDLEDLERECELARRSGFGGKRAVHPAQLPTIRRAFEIPTEAYEWAVAVTDAMRAGEGATRLGDNSQMVDAATLQYARSVIAERECE